MRILLAVLLSLIPLSASAEYLGELSANAYGLDSTANAFGAGSPFKPDGINNPYSPTAVRSATSRRQILSPPMPHGFMTSRVIIVAS